MPDRYAGELEDPSPTGINTWSMGEFDWRSETQPEDLLTSALDYELEFLDTSPLYDEGRSEQLVGKLLEDREERSSFFLASKGGLVSNDRGGYDPLVNYDRCRRQVTETLRRLRTDRLDLFSLYDVRPHEESLAWLKKLKEEDLIRYRGLVQFERDGLPEPVSEGLDVLYRPGCPLDVSPEESARVPRVRTVGYDPFFGGLFDQEYAEVDSEVLDYEVRRHHPKFSSDRVEYLSLLKSFVGEVREKLGRTVRLEVLILSLLEWVSPDDRLVVGMRNAADVHLVQEAPPCELLEEEYRNFYGMLWEVLRENGCPEFLNPPPLLPRHSFERHVLGPRLESPE